MDDAAGHQRINVTAVRLSIGDPQQVGQHRAHRRGVEGEVGRAARKMPHVVEPSGGLEAQVERAFHQLGALVAELA